MADTFKEFQQAREEMNRLILSSGDLGIKRFFALDKNAYGPGALPAETKELLGLVASLVMRCQDCVFHHLERCISMNFSREQIYEAFSIGLLVGGSIVIPQLRNAAAVLEELISDQDRPEP